MFWSNDCSQSLQDPNIKNHASTLYWLHNSHRRQKLCEDQSKRSQDNLPEPQPCVHSAINPRNSNLPPVFICLTLTNAFIKVLQSTLLQLIVYGNLRLFSSSQTEHRNVFVISKVKNLSCISSVPPVLQTDLFDTCPFDFRQCILTRGKFIMLAFFLDDRITC
ncbi:hypothetical protein RRG08_005266 [Elysia crispata]|uniref:Uncharacterized protein n=1 Tax=Elysia crispata TaxID=231223 RepID=A0AAE1CW21_9GAST|nr:hypothetical protein RRG08_005266 [Elysia crispata]